MAKVTVHHLNNSRSQRVLWLLEELEVPYEVIRYERDAKTMLAPASLRKIHPLGKSPVVTANGNTVAESGAIVEYLLKEYGNGRLQPQPDTSAYLQMKYWLHYAEGSAMPPLLLKLIFTQMPKRAPALMRPLVRLVTGSALKGFIDPQVKLHMDYWEQSLQASGYFTGEEFSAADIQMSFPVEAGTARLSSGVGPRLSAFLKAIHARPAYQRALARGGPYNL